MTEPNQPVPQWCVDAAMEFQRGWNLSHSSTRDLARIIARHAPQQPQPDLQDGHPPNDSPLRRHTVTQQQQPTKGPMSEYLPGGYYAEQPDPQTWRDSMQDIAEGNVKRLQELCEQQPQETYTPTKPGELDRLLSEAHEAAKQPPFPVFSMSDVFGTTTFHQHHEGRYGSGETPRLGDVVRVIEGIDRITTGDVLVIDRLVRGADDTCRWVGLKDHEGLDYFPSRFALVRRKEFASVPEIPDNSENESSNDAPRCPSCDVAFREHLGLTGTCKQLAEANAEIEKLQSEVDAQNASLTEKINLIASIRTQMQARDLFESDRDNLINNLKERVESLRVQLNEERDHHEKEYAALRRRKIKFCKMNGVLEAMDMRDEQQQPASDDLGIAAANQCVKELESHLNKGGA